ncbi:MAG: hypothetical protein AAF502_07640 [Bacteroidota bacterium]
MRYLFFVNNHISHLTAKGIIKHLELKIDDCTFLTERNYEIENPLGKTLEFPFSHLPDSFRVALGPIRLRQKIKSLDSFINTISDHQPFEIFVTQTSITYFYLIHSNPNCKGFSLIEGGLGCYNLEYLKMVSHKAFWLRRLLYRLLYRNRVPELKYFFNIDFPKFKNCYGTNDKAFKGFKNQIVLDNPFTNDTRYKGINNVLVLDAIREFNYISSDAVKFVLTFLLEKLKNDIEQLHFKFHPEHYRRPEDMAFYKNIFAPYQKHFTIIELDKHTVLENLIHSSDANFYVFVSSIGMYADMMGKKVFSLAKKLTERENTFKFQYESYHKGSIQYL